jgi:hypothetical protein
MTGAGGIILGAIVVIAIGITKLFVMAVDCCFRTRIHVEYNAI